MPRPRSIGATKSRRRCGNYAPSIRATSRASSDCSITPSPTDAPTRPAPRSRKSRRAGRTTPRLRKRCCRGRWASRASIQSNCARRSRMRHGNEASVFLIARQDVDGYNADIESRGAIPRGLLLRQSLQQQTRGPRDAARSAGQGELGALRLSALLARKRLAKRMPSAGRDRFRMRHRCRAGALRCWLRRIEMSFFTELKRRKATNVISGQAASGSTTWTKEKR